MKSWFKHDYAARNDDKVLELRAEFGWEGYGIFWAIIEYMAETNGGIDTRKIGAVSIGLGVDKTLLTRIIEFCRKVELFESDGKIVRNRRLSSHLSEIEAKREGGSQGGKRSAQKRGSNNRASRNPSSIPNTTPSSIPSSIPSRSASTDKIDKIDKIERESDARTRAGRSLSDFASLIQAPEIAEMMTDIASEHPRFPAAAESWYGHLSEKMGKPPTKAMYQSHMHTLSKIADPVGAIDYSITNGHKSIYSDWDDKPTRPNRQTTTTTADEASGWKPFDDSPKPPGPNHPDYHRVQTPPRA
jgi:hypothetical protein